VFTLFNIPCANDLFLFLDFRLIIVVLRLASAAELQSRPTLTNITETPQRDPFSKDTMKIKIVCALNIVTN